MIIIDQLAHKKGKEKRNGYQVTYYHYQFIIYSYIL